MNLSTSIISSTILIFPVLCIAATYQCDDFVITEDPSSFTGCVDISTRLPYSSEKEKPDGSSAGDSDRPAVTQQTPALRPPLTQKESERREAELERKRKDAECIKDLQCWGGRASMMAGFRCRKPIEDQTEFAFKWTDGMFGAKFTHFRWLDQKKGYVTTFGDKLTVQNVFGAWVAYRYECDVDVKGDRVLAVRVEPGRIN